ncbi:hypothetical protein [Streptomyces sp. NPDC054837]
MQKDADCYAKAVEEAIREAIKHTLQEWGLAWRELDRQLNEIIHFHNHFHNTNITAIGTMSGGSVTMGSGATARHQESDPEMNHTAANRGGDGVRPPSGGISIGRLTGGAVAAGERASAEDRGQRVGHADHRDAPVPAEPPQEGISIGTMSGGAAASGVEAHAIDASVQITTNREELCEVIRALRVQLLSQPRTQESAEIDRELTELEDEITQYGRADRSRLERVRERLEVGTMAAAGGASAAAMVQAIAQLFN